MCKSSNIAQQSSAKNARESLGGVTAQKRIIFAVSKHPLLYIIPCRECRQK
jgi:hypothetical protein